MGKQQKKKDTKVVATDPKKSHASCGAIEMTTDNRAYVVALDLLRLSPGRIERIRDLIRLVSTTVCAAYPGLSIKVVGSTASGLATECSDIDFVLCPSSQDTTCHARLYDISTELGISGLQTEVVVARNIAPSVIKCSHPKLALTCDVTLQDAGKSFCSNELKTLMIRHMSRNVQDLGPMVLLLKQWATMRKLTVIDAVLNSFSWTLMVIGYLQACETIPQYNFETAHKDIQDSEVDITAMSFTQNLEISPEFGLKFAGFFKYWASFDYPNKICCVRLSKHQSRLNESKRDSQYAFRIEDPIEQHENTARTLAAKNLQRLRAELNRASVMLSQGEPWASVCSAASKVSSKRRLELKPYLMPEQSLQNSQDFSLRSSNIHGLDGSHALISKLKEFALEAKAGSTIRFAELLSGAERRSLHHAADILGIRLIKVGKGIKGKHQVQISKPTNWSPPVPIPSTEIGIMARAPWSTQDCKTASLLRDGMTIQELVLRYKLNHRYHPDLPLLQFSYNQVDSNFSLEVVRECRGLILELGTWRVIAMPFTKFFNCGELLAAKLNWRTAKVMEKLDGSILTLYWYDDRWHVSSSKLPSAEGKLPCCKGGDSRTFAEMFWGTFRSNRYSLPKSKGACYMFELCLPDTTIVVRHKVPKLVCIGARDLKSLIELDSEEVSLLNGWEAASHFKEMKCLTDVVDAACKLNPVEHEGFVVVDQHFNRVKIKSPRYIALHHLGNNIDRSMLMNSSLRMCQRRVLEIARASEGSEFLSYYPELKDAYQLAEHQIEQIKILLGTNLTLAPRYHSCEVSVSRVQKKMARNGWSPSQVLARIDIRELEDVIEAIQRSNTAGIASTSISDDTNKNYLHNVGCDEEVDLGHDDDSKVEQFDGENSDCEQEPRKNVFAALFEDIDSSEGDSD